MRVLGAADVTRGRPVTPRQWSSVPCASRHPQRLYPFIRLTRSIRQSTSITLLHPYSWFFPAGASTRLHASPSRPRSGHHEERATSPRTLHLDPRGGVR